MLQRIQRGWTKPGWMNRLLYPVGLLNAGVMQLRAWGYRAGVRARCKLPVPVIVVGNLSVGGTGKTPLLIALVAVLQRRGYAVGVVARGYGGQPIAPPRSVTANDAPAAVGDEPVLIFHRCRIPVVVGADRVAAARRLIQQHGCNVVVSDDGFQHLRLHRDLDIVVIDGERGLGNGWCLPAGPLREPRSALKRASLLVVNGGPATALPGWQALAGRPCHRYTITADALYRLDRRQHRQLGEFAGRRVHAVAGLGNPKRFFDCLEQAGLRLVKHVFADHHCYDDADFAFADADSTIIMTEKDAVKCTSLALPEDVWVLPITVQLSAAFLDQFAALLARAAAPE